MAMNTNVSTEGYEPVSGAVPRMAISPPIELQPLKSPFFISSFPTTAVVNPDAIRNFNTHGIPVYRITPPIPLTAASGATNTIATAKTQPVLLQGVPSPTIASSLVSVAAGYQFSYNEVGLPLSSTLAISSYKIYRNTANNSASAVVIQTNPHNVNGITTPVVVTDNVPNGVTQFYWVTAVSTSGKESSFTPAQSGPVTNNAIANSNSRLASTFHGLPNNSTVAPTSASVLSNTGGSSIVVANSSILQTGSGQISYNSGSCDPGGFGTSGVFADDPTFGGGSVVYVSTLSGSPFTSTDADGNLNFGLIHAVLGTAKTGGGFTGGDFGSTGVGGRGFVAVA